MKKFKIYLIAALGLAMFQEVSAQPERQRGMTQSTGKAVLYNQVSDLTDEQKEQIDEIYSNLKNENKALMEQLRENNEEARASVRALLTDEQLDQLADVAMSRTRTRTRMNRGSEKTMGRQRMQQRQFDPKAMANREKQALYENITDLTDDQKSVIDEIYTQYATDLSKAFEAAEGDREKMRTEIREVRSGKQELLKEILTEEQWVKAEELAKKARERRRGNRPPQK